MSVNHEAIVTIIAVPVSLAGIFGNTIFVIAVRRYKDLRTKHGVLVSSLCIYQSVCLLSEVLASAQLLLSEPPMRRYCYYAFLPYLVCSFVQLSLMLIIALDLIFLILKPTRYQAVNIFPYSLLVQLPCLLFALTMVVFYSANLDNKTIFMCNSVTVVPPAISDLVNYSMLSVCTAILISYCSTTIYMWHKDYVQSKKSEGTCSIDPSLRYQRKLIKTLSVVMTSFLFSAFASALLVRLTLSLDIFSVKTNNVIQSYSVLPGLISYAQNFYVYNLVSKDYHKAFKKMWQATRKDISRRLSTDSRKTSIGMAIITQSGRSDRSVLNL